MVKMKRILFFTLFISILASCKNDSIDKSQIQRPIDTWVFRSVLDQNPRMITAALDKDLYVSYYTQTGSLYKAWKGIVNFEGAVYDGAHGPQPTSVGDAYLIQTKEFKTWEVLKNGKTVDFEYNYKGHRNQNNMFTLLHEVKVSDQSINIEESIDSKKKESGQIEFHRNLKLQNSSPSEYQINFIGSAILIDTSIIQSGGELRFTKAETLKYEGKTYLDCNFKMTLSEGDNSVVFPLYEAVYKDPNIDDGFEVTSDLPEGGVLISKNDCRTCHNAIKKTVGPSYKSIAQKYEHSDENVLMLANKIKKGGSGIWGEQVMTPHPEISDYDLKSMVSYIFTLDDYQGQNSSKKETELLLSMPTEVKEENLIPGAVTRIYKIPTGTEKIPVNKGQLKLIQGGMMPNFDNLTGVDFNGLEKDFALFSEGYLYIEEDGIYDFRLWSDDGSKLFINKKLLIDHDGLHGTSMVQGRLKMKKGYYPFKLEFFQGGGGQFLSVNYKSEKSKYWEVIPSQMFFHHKDQQELVVGLTLPMSNIARIPGDGVALQGVHPSFDLSQARPDEFEKKIGGLEFLSDGRMVVSVWDTEGGVYLLENTDGDDFSAMTYKRIAHGLAEPLGLKAVGDRLFVMQKQEITELIDLDGDDIIDEYRTVCDSWGVSDNFHEFGFGLEEKDGYLYANLATGIMPGGAGMVGQHSDRGSCIKVSIETGEMEIVANGLRTPNGIGLGYNGELFIADNQGDWLPSSKIVHVTKNAWFGSRAVDFEGTANKVEKKPVVWLPQDEIGNSPSTPMYLNIGPYKNQMIHGEVTHGGIKRVYVEEVEGQLQGCVFRFTQGMEAGINRIKWGSRDVLYAGGIGNPGNWQHSGTQWYGLQKLKYNNKSTFEMLSISARSNGIEIEFTEPLTDGDGWLKDDYLVKQWYYLPTKEYGGPKLDERELDIKSINVSKDRLKVFLELDGLKEDHVVYVKLMNHFVSEKNNSLWSTEGWYTMNRIPSNKNGFISSRASIAKDNSLTPYEKDNNWELLFDGKTLNKFHTFKSDKVDTKWNVKEGTVFFNPQADGQGGDLVTNDEYENFEFKLEWKISNCGNSGLFFNVQEEEKYCCTWQTGPEMQILDNTCHPDTRYVTHRAGDLYDMIQCQYPTVKPAGQWNKIRIKSENGKIEFWQNGHKVVSFEMHNDKWQEMIANSKFKEMKSFGQFKKGMIALQDHGDKVWFKNIKIKKL